MAAYDDSAVARAYTRHVAREWRQRDASRAEVLARALYDDEVSVLAILARARIVPPPANQRYVLLAELAAGSSARAEVLQICARLCVDECLTQLVPERAWRLSAFGAAVVGQLALQGRTSVPVLPGSGECARCHRIEPVSRRQLDGGGEAELCSECGAAEARLRAAPAGAKP